MRHEACKARQERRLTRVVRRAAGEWTDAGIENAAHARVHVLDLADGPDRPRRVGEDERQHEIEGAPQALERTLAEAAVRRHARRDQRVRDLQEQRPPAAEQDDRLAVDAPGDARGTEEALGRVDRGAGGPQPIEVRGRQSGGHAADSTRPASSSAAAGRIHERALIAARVSGTLVVRDTDLRRALASSAPAVIGGEAHVVDAPVPRSRAFRAHLRGVPLADAGRVGARVAVAEAVQRLVLADAGDHHAHGVSVGIGHTADPDGHVLVVRRPELRRAHPGVAAVGRGVAPPLEACAAGARGSVGGERRRAGARPRIARGQMTLVRGHAGRRRTGACARLADVTPGARDPVAAAGAVGLGRVGARARRGVTGPGVVALIRRAAPHRARSGADARLAGVRLRAGVPVVARLAVRTRAVGRAIVRRAVTALRRITLPRGGAAHLGLLGVGRTAGARSRAQLGHVADAGRIAARDGRRLEGVGRAGVVRPVAPLVDVARAGRRPADVGRLLHVRGAGGVGAGARLRRIADAGGGATLGARGLEPIRRARVVRAVAALVGVAWARCRAADVDLLRIVGAAGTRAGAGLRRVTDAGRRATLDARGLEAVDRARIVRAVAPLLHVARTGGQAADAGSLRVGRARRPGAGAELGRVTGAGRRTAGGGRGLEAVRRAVIVRPVAALLHVARTRRRTADARLLLVGGARGTRAGAGLGRVARAGRRAALERRGLQRVRRTLPARARAELRHVAGAGRGPAHRGGRLELAVGRAAVAVQLVAVVAVLARVDDAVAAARAHDRGIDDPGDAVVQVHHVVVADAALGAVHAGDDLGVAVEEGRILEPIAARRRRCPPSRTRTAGSRCGRRSSRW